MLTSGEESKSSLMIIPLPWRIASSGLRGDVVGAKRYQQKVLLIYIYIYTCNNSYFHKDRFNLITKNTFKLP